MKLAAVEVSKSFDSKRKVDKKFAVNKMSISVEPGQFVAIVGESGSGKSTVARLLLNLLPATEGIVTFNNIEVSKLSRRQKQEFRQSVQSILQDPSGSLNPRKSVRQSLMEVVRLHHTVSGKLEQLDHVHKTLESVGLFPAENYADRFPHELSGGQRQRVLIARALILNPQIIIADEAVSALDVSVKASILNLINRLRREKNIGYIFISHDLPVVKKVADYVYVMKDGVVVEEGTKDEIFRQPKTAYVRELIASAPEPDPKEAKEWLLALAELG
ncbi:MAG: ATP-binding cassette domain-containing protein [Microbacteriaceae bacterium]